MGTLPRALSPQEPLQAVIARFATERADALPVIDGDGRLLGIVAATDLEQAIGQAEHQMDDASAADFLRAAPELRAHETLDDAVLALAGTDEEGLPVLASDSDRVVGWLTHRRLLRAYRARLRKST
jgi:CIC family chloride channel protein